MCVCFAVLCTLQRLSLDSNRLKVLPNNMGACSKLEYFSASRNRLRALPDTLDGLSSLTFLSLSQVLHAYSTHFCLSPHHLARVLVASGAVQNKLVALPNSICRMRSLQVLRVARNRITTLPMQFFM